MEAFVKANAVVRVRRTWLRVATLTVPFVVAFFTALLLGPDLTMAGLVMVALMIALDVQWRWWPSRKRGVLRVERGVMTVDGTPIATSGAHPRMEKRGERVIVCFDHFARGVAIDVATVGEGALLLSTLGIAAKRVTLEEHEPSAEETPPMVAVVMRFIGGKMTQPGSRSFVTMHGSARGWSIRVVLYVVAFVVLTLALIAIGNPWVVVPALALFVATAALHMMVRIDVGVDGLRLRHMLRERFISFASIARVLHDAGDVAIEVGEGRWVSVFVPGESDDAAQLVASIEAERQKAAEREPVDPTAFTRAGRELGDWMKAVTGAMEANASFRTQAVPAETLWRIVEDGAAPATARAGAALAIRPTLDADGRARLRVLADGSADPRLRVALTTLSAEDDDALEGVLARVADRV